MDGALAYLLVAPSSVRKGRFGPILSRLLSRSASELVAVQSIPFDSVAAAGAADWIGGPPPRHVDPADWTRSVARSLTPVPGGPPNIPGVLLLFRGEGAWAETIRLLGDFPGANTDDSLRGSFGELERDGDGRILFCEPVGFAAASAIAVRRDLARFADGMSAEARRTETTGKGAERTLVLVKPDNFRHGGGRPGHVADLFCRSGLALVGARLVRFSVRQALDFYGPVREALRTRLDGVAGGLAAHELAGGELGIGFGPELTRELGRVLGPVYGEQRFRNLVKFMAGREPGAVGDPVPDEPGTETTLALVFEGPDAVSRMRAVLGPTDPSKAPPGTVRREFGRTLLENAGHASDSAGNAAREIGLVQPWACDLGRWSKP